jgi:hypothetical protein
MRPEKKTNGSSTFYTGPIGESSKNPEPIEKKLVNNFFP